MIQLHSEPIPFPQAARGLRAQAPAAQPRDTLPLRCGVDATGFVTWASPLDEAGKPNVDPTLRNLTPSETLVEFCRDCDAVFRARAEIAGTCDFAQFFEGAAPGYLNDSLAA